jgi:hypothetical protein
MVSSELSVANLLKMGEDIELDNEVKDLYHQFPPWVPKSKRTEKVVVTGAASLESTPTKSDRAGAQVTPRRSPRLHSQGVEGMGFIIVKLNVTDRTGVHPSIEVPKVMIFAQDNSPRGQEVRDLKLCLQDKSDERFKMTFDLCKYLKLLHITSAWYM